MDITKVIVPAAGLGERFLPFSKTIPQELLPILRKPAIHHIAQEMADAGCHQMTCITAPGKEALMSYFDYTTFNHHLTEMDQTEHFESLKKIQKTLTISSVEQHEPRGTGHAVWRARHMLNKEYFGVAYPDDLIMGKQPAIGQLVRIARQEKATVIAVQEVPRECISSYGIIGIKKTITPNLFQVGSVIEKPSLKDAPSSLAIVGRYVLSSKIITILDDMIAYEPQEISLTDAIGKLIHSNERIFAVKLQGTRYDLGSYLGWVKAVIATSMNDAQLGSSVRSFLADHDTPDSFMYKPAKMIQDNV